MDRTQSSPHRHKGKFRPQGSNAFAVAILGAVLGFSAFAAYKVYERQVFTNQAIEVMRQFSEAKATGLPLDSFQERFEPLAESERSVGRLMTIAYVERTGTLSERDQAILDAANQLSGIELYRVLKATSPLFEPKVREGYLGGGEANRLFPGVDLAMTRLTADQREAMLSCYSTLKVEYEPMGIAGRFKVAAAFFAGVTWESCRIPESPRYESKGFPLKESI